MTAGAWAAGDVFEGLAPELVGAEFTSVLEGAELACHQDLTNPQIRRCVPLPGALARLGDVGVSTVEALFKDGRLAQVAIYFPEARFAQMLPVLSARLGEGSDWSATVRSGMAGQFSDQIRIWETDRFVLVAQQFDRKIDRSSVIYGSEREMAPLLQRIKATPRGGLRDL